MGNFQPAEPERTGTLATQVYEQLRREIVSARLLPGEKLPVEALRERFGVGGSPLREALIRLSVEGLVLQEDQKGFRVSTVSPDELVELTRTRCWINELALRESIAGGDAAWEEAVLLAFHRLSRIPTCLDGEPTRLNPAWEQQHQVFHNSLIAACPSRWIVSFNNLLFDCADRYRNLVAIVGQSGRDVLGEHRAIMEATIGRKTETAISLLNDHFTRTTDSLLKSLPDAMRSSNAHP
jgi:GntR family transcriptional regulator, carbon starvation induced regulator